MQRKLISLLIAGVVAGIASPAYSLDDKAVLKRLDQLEAQRRADQNEIQALRSKVQQLETQKSGAVTSTEAAQLREEIVKVDKKAATRAESVKKTLESERDKLKINGYMSVYGVKSTNKAVDLGSGVDNHIGFNSDTIAGIQFDYKLDDRLDAVVQLQAQGRDDYDVDTSWAFLRYKLTPDTNIRAGRMIAPLYLYADSLDVGFTYPWVRPPTEMYGTTSQHYTGVDVIHNFHFGDWNNSVQAIYGDFDTTISGTNANADYLAGLALTVNNDAWTLRAAGFHFEGFGLDAPAPLGFVSGNLDYYSGSIRYDNGSLLVLAEARQIAPHGDLEILLGNSDGFYSTVGYQFGDFMPYATWGKTYSTDESSALVEQSQQSTGIGLRYNLTSKVVIKGEATKYDHFDGTAGTLGMVTLPGVGAALNPANAATLQELDDDGATVMSLGVDAVF